MAVSASVLRTTRVVAFVRTGTTLVLLLRLMALLLGAAEAWAGRYEMTPDGISYLDLADYFGRGDWLHGVNALWSPLYPFLLGLFMRVARPDPFWEFPAVHLLNLGIYVFALGCFEFFLRQWLRDEELRHVSSPQEQVLPQQARMVLGYGLFIWSSLNLMNPWWVSPDLLFAAFVYLSVGFALLVRRDHSGMWPWGALGFVLGLGYLAKVPLLTLAPVILVVAFPSALPLRRVTTRVAFAVGTLMLVAWPFILGLSMAQHRFTLGESARLNYLWHVNQITYRNWQGEGTVGRPLHPTRRIFRDPPVYEFAEPIHATYAPWFDPAYWFEGATPRFDLRGHLSQIRSAAKTYYGIFVREQAALVTAGLTLLLLGSLRSIRRRILVQIPLLAPAIAGLAMFAAVHLEPRFIGSFVTLLWLGVFSLVTVPDRRSARWATTLVVVALLVLMASTADRTLYAVRETARSLRGIQPSRHVDWQVAEALREMGLNPGDRVAVIGAGEHAYWARLAHVRIIAELPAEATNAFWSAQPETRASVLQALRQTGTRVAVARPVSVHELGQGWSRIKDTGYYVFNLGAK